jgi:hypothetical protein
MEIPLLQPSGVAKRKILAEVCLLFVPCRDLQQRQLIDNSPLTLSLRTPFAHAAFQLSRV